MSDRLLSTPNLAALADDLLARAKRHGATAADLVLVEAEPFSARVRLGAVERIESAQEKRLGLRCFAGARSAVCSTSDLSPETLEAFVTETCRLARLTAEDDAAGLPDSTALATTIPDLRLWDGAAAALSVEERIAWATRAEAAALSADPKITNSEGADFDSTTARVVYASSAGFLGEYAASRVGLSVSPVASDDGRMQTDYWYTAGRHLRHLDAPETVGQIAARRTLRRLGARPVATREAPVVFDPETASQLLRHLAGALSGYALYQGASFLLGRLDQQMASPLVTIVDDGTIPEAVGSRPFDGEGLPTRKTVVVEQGVLRSYLLDCYTARKLGRRPTGHATRSVGDSPGAGPTNLRILPGSVSPEEIIRSVPEGLYVTQLIGFGVNLATGDYSQGAAGLWIDRGELAYPVEEITIAGNLKEILLQIEAVGSDLPPHRAIAAPTLKLARLTIAGR